SSEENHCLNRRINLAAPIEPIWPLKITLQVFQNLPISSKCNEWRIRTLRNGVVLAKRHAIRKKMIQKGYYSTSAPFFAKSVEFLRHNYRDLPALINFPDAASS